jgi:hypothetical protein
LIENGEIRLEGVFNDIHHFTTVDGGGDFEALVEGGVEVESGLFLLDWGWGSLLARQRYS